MKHSKSALVLMELIIVILFFSLSAAVCIQFFAKSHMLSEQTVNENHAVVYAQNLAECFLATEGDTAQIQSILKASASDSNTVLLYFDQNWKSCDEQNAHYIAKLSSHSEAEGLITADITIAPYPSASEDSIYALTVMHHIPERRGSLDH